MLMEQYYFGNLTLTVECGQREREPRDWESLQKRADSISFREKDIIGDREIFQRSTLTVEGIQFVIEHMKIFPLPKTEWDKVL